MTLRHEVLGHYGANTFAPAEKRALLDGLAAVRNEPTLKPLWDDVNRRYADQSLDVRAEEVFALHCEGIEPSQHQVADQVQQRGQQSFTETCIARVRPMQADDLHNIVCMVAQGLRDRSRTQQNFPQFNELFRRDENMEPKKPFHEVVAEKLIEQLKAGTAPWQKPWEPGEPNAYLPMNPTTGKRYKGINAIHLMAQGRSDARWMTYKQAAAMDAQVRKGEKGTPVQYWKFSEEQDKLDGNGKPVLDAKGQPVRETVMLERPRVFFATVFNGEQIDGLPAIQKKEQAWNAVERAEHILKASCATITHAPGDRAFYRPATDSITLPERGQFPSADRYYATALHELGHWTGHESRLDRDLVHPFGSEGYAKEELRAEIASMILGDELGIGHDPGQHAAYVGSWIKALQDDPLEVFRAAADAEKIYGYVLGLEQKQIQEQTTQEANMQTLTEAAGLSVADARVAGARLDLATGNTFSPFSRVRDRQAFDQYSEQALGFKLPHDWTGQVQIVGVIERDGLAMRADEAGQQPQAFQVYARKWDVQPGEDAFALLATRPNEAAAQELADRLALIDAHSQVNEHDKAAKLARINEERVRRDPNSTDEDIAAAKEARKDAEFKATQNDDDLQRRIAEFEREQQQAPAPTQATQNAYQAELARLLQLSTLTPGSYTPSDQVKAANHAAVFVNEEPAILCGPSDDPASVAQAEALAASPQVQAAFRAAGMPGAINSGVVAGEHVQWQGTEAAVVSKPSGQVEPGGDDGPLVAIVLNDPKQALTTSLCVTTATARIFDDNAPELDDGRKLPALAGGETLPPGVKTFIAVPFREKEQAKALGAKWDRQEQSWYVPANVDPAPFAKWSREAAQQAVQVTQAPAAPKKGVQERQYLAVPYGEHVAAKAAGALWDKAAKSWYAGPKADMAKLERWKPENVPAQQGPAMTPEQEFADALKSMGCVVAGGHPIMDGKKHRIEVEGDKKGEKAGFYVGHLDGHPAGFIKNNRTGIDMKWKSKGYSLDPEQKAAMQAEAAAKLAARAEQHAQEQERAAQRVGKQMADLVPITTPTPYLEAKGITPQVGVFTDRDGQKTYIPATDENGKQWTMQYIQEDGTKRFAKESRKEGCFHAIGGLDAIAAAPAIVIGEGYATAASVSQALGYGTVAAFDSGNLEAVAKVLHEKYPDKPIVIAGDDDRHLESTQGINPGKVKALAAAKAVGGKAIFPVFAPGEAAYPKELPPVTPQAYREHLSAVRAVRALEDVQTEPDRVQLTEQHAAELKRAQLSAEQLAALNAMKRHTDFNDLANKSVLGIDGLERQVQAAVAKAIEKHQGRDVQQTQQQEHRAQQQERRPRVARI
ncbi:hypothetical protein BO993_24135 (plasmid) [Xanthomonas oryzae pv. oryzae]|nr:zincin-like metallopeptidase domain-containing protein [Xanthomonas oryzae]AZK89879.1 hypothetical protein BO993_24135 [Xanthomonas oryzae pv. oryzae]